MKERFVKLLFIGLLAGSLIVSSLPFFGFVTAIPITSDITEDTVWTMADSPYEILNDIKVNAGVTLTIEPSVVVSFNDNATLIVEGSLIAVGNSSSQITFTSNNPAPSRGQWTSVRFVGGSSESFIFRFVDVKYAKNGIVIESLGNAVIERSGITSNSLSGIHVVGETNLLIQNNTIDLNDKGISTSGATTYGLRIVDNQISNNEHGIYLYVYGNNSRISNITISGNVFNTNTNGIFLHSHAAPTSVPTGGNAYINDIAIVDNLLESGEYGIHLLAEAWGEPGLLGGGSYIYNSVISGNTAYFNDYAIYIDSTSNWYSWISDVAISKNKILANKDGVLVDAFRTPQPPFKNDPFDTTIVENIVSANDNAGINIKGDVRANITANSVSYNSYGAYISSRENMARENDIYANSEYGMYVAKGRGTIDGQIDAENNFWGDINGPFHESLNPDGQGDRVNGDGVNLDFRPFLDAPQGYVNEAPVAKLGVSRSTVTVNEPISFDGLNSVDDLRVTRFFFDFGDGEDSGWMDMPIIRHRYASPGVYNASLVVMDELGVRSNNTAVRTVTINLALLEIFVFLDPIFVFPQEQVLIEANILDQESVGVENVLVELTSNEGGTFDPASGYTGANGGFNSTFTAPEVSVSTGVIITVSVYKEGYENMSQSYDVSVLFPSSGNGGLDTSWILPVSFLAVIIAASVMAIVKRRKRRRRFAKHKVSARVSICCTRMIAHTL